MRPRGPKPDERDRPSREGRGGVLVVAEGPAERARLREALSQLQTETLEAGSTAGALELLAREPTVEVLVTVHEQDGMTGGALCQYLRGHARLAGISTVLIADQRSLTGLRFSARAADELLERPCDVHELRLVVRNALRAQARRRLLGRQERRRAIDWLAMVLAHEINNPLATAMANLSLVRERSRHSDVTELVEESHAMLERIRERTNAVRLPTRPQDHAPVPLTALDLIELLSARLRRHGRLTQIDADLRGIMDGRAYWRLLVEAADAVAENSLSYCGGAINARVHFEPSRLAVVVHIQGECADDPEIILEPRLLSRDGETPRFYPGLSMLEAAFAEVGGQLFARPVRDGWRFGLTVPIEPSLATIKIS